MDDQSKPVVMALREIAEGFIVPATHEEMGKMKEAKRIVRERALMEAQEEDPEDKEGSDDSYASAHPEEETEQS